MENENSELNLVWGGSAIAALIGRSRRQTFHMLNEGQLPAKKIGERWVADRKKLEEFFSEVTA